MLRPGGLLCLASLTAGHGFRRQAGDGAVATRLPDRPGPRGRLPADQAVAAHLRGALGGPLPPRRLPRRPVQRGSWSRAASRTARRRSGPPALLPPPSRLDRRIASRFPWRGAHRRGRESDHDDRARGRAAHHTRTGSDVTRARVSRLAAGRFARGFSWPSEFPARHGSHGFLRREGGNGEVPDPGIRRRRHGRRAAGHRGDDRPPPRRGDGEDAAKAQTKAAEAQAAANRGAEDGRRQERLKNRHRASGPRVGFGTPGRSLRALPSGAGHRGLASDGDGYPLRPHPPDDGGEDEYREKHRSKPSEEVQSLLTLLFVEEHEVFKGCGIHLREAG